MYLRGDKHAQYEIQAYAEVIAKIVAKWVPLAYEAFIKYRVEGANFFKPRHTGYTKKASG